MSEILTMAPVQWQQYRMTLGATAKSGGYGLTTFLAEHASITGLLMTLTLETSAQVQVPVGTRLQLTGWPVAGGQVAYNGYYMLLSQSADNTLQFTVAAGNGAVDSIGGKVSIVLPFRAASVIGRKDWRINNAGTVWLGPTATAGFPCFDIASGESVPINIQNGYADFADWSLDGTEGDGVVIVYR